MDTKVKDAPEIQWKIWYPKSPNFVSHSVLAWNSHSYLAFRACHYLVLHLKLYQSGFHHWSTYLMWSQVFMYIPPTTIIRKNIFSYIGPALAICTCDQDFFGHGYECQNTFKDAKAFVTCFSVNLTSPALFLYFSDWIPPSQGSPRDLFQFHA